MTIYIGVDPGKSGAIVAIYPDGEIRHARSDWTEADVSEWLADTISGGKCHATLEYVASSPQQGVRSAFTFGQSYGFLRGILVAHRVPFETVTPAKWQAAMKCRSKGDKNVTKARAQELFPLHKWTHRTADAVLLAEYGRRLYCERVMAERLDDERRNITGGD